MSEPYLGEIRLWAIIYVPQYWLACEGQTLKISEYAALYSLLGTTYGGDGLTTFNLPDLRGCTLMGVDQETNTFARGTYGGKETRTMTVSTMPSHTHEIMADASSGTMAFSKYNYLANPVSKNGDSDPLYVKPSSLTPTTTALNADSVGKSGGDTAYASRQPYLVMQYCIATYGIYPSRS